MDDRAERDASSALALDGTLQSLGIGEQPIDGKRDDCALCPIVVPTTSRSTRGRYQCRLLPSSILGLPASNRPGNVYDTHDLVVASNHTNTGTVADPREDLVRSSCASAHS